jgi:tRNA dimethylallyltransferase
MPIVVGGTGFYLQALVKGLAPIPPVPPHILHETQDQSLEHAYGKLDQVDPVTAKRLQPGDTQRIIRALSVWNATGRTLSAWQVLPRVPLPYPFRVHCVLPEKDVLHQRLRSRLNHMVSGGVFEEVRLFMEQLSPKALQTSPVTRALGFREIQKFWEGTMTQREAVERIFQLTRQYAKRQMTWLRHQKWGD